MAVARLALGRFEDAALAAWEVSDQQKKRWQHRILYSCMLIEPQTARGSWGRLGEEHVKSWAVTPLRRAAASTSRTNSLCHVPLLSSSLSFSLPAPPLSPECPLVTLLQGVQLDNDNAQLKSLLQKCVEQGRATIHGPKS